MQSKPMAYSRTSRACVRLLASASLLGTCAFAQAAIPPAERAVLMDLYASANGPGWTNKSGWGGAPGSECSWHGIVCDPGGTTILEIHIDGNNLSGTLPALDGLTNLQLFFAGDNQLSGSIPALAALTNLRYLALGSNQLSGGIPPLAALTQLNYFDVGNNTLTGTIPDLSGLGSLTRFDVSDNQLSGFLPALVGLTELQAFNASDNHLSGGIPALTGLVNLENIFLGGNLLGGPPPAVPSPSALLADGSTLCPNYLNHVASGDWDQATGSTPWYQTCTSDVIFRNGFDPS